MWLIPPVRALPRAPLETVPPELVGVGLPPGPALVVPAEEGWREDVERVVLGLALEEGVLQEGLVAVEAEEDVAEEAGEGVRGME